MCAMQKDGSSEKSADKSTNELIKWLRLTFGHHNLALAMLHLTIIYLHFCHFSSSYHHGGHVDISITDRHAGIRKQSDLMASRCSWSIFPSWSYCATLYIVEEKKVMPIYTLFHWAQQYFAKKKAHKKTHLHLDKAAESTLQFWLNTDSMTEISIALKQCMQRQPGFSRSDLNCIPYVPAQHPRKGRPLQ